MVKYVKPKGKDGCRKDSREMKSLREENERLRKELEDALIESCKYFDCSYREAIKGE